MTWQQILEAFKPAPKLDGHERAMKAQAQQILARPNNPPDVILLCQKVLIACAKREGQPAPAFHMPAWRSGYLYLENAVGQKGGTVPFP